MSIKTNKAKYEGFTLVEMLLTIVIIGIVMLISMVTLTTLIKTSTVSSNKTKVRNESEYVLELIRRSVRNSNPSDVFIYNSRNARVFNKKNNKVVSKGGTSPSTVYANSLGENQVGNEIHFRPFGSNSWVCIGYFKSIGSDQGYVVKTTAEDLLGKHDTCFDSNRKNSYFIVLNSDYVIVNNFQIAYTKTADENYLIRFDIDSEPMFWYLSKKAPVTKRVLRQAVVKTGGLIW